MKKLLILLFILALPIILFGVTFVGLSWYVNSGLYSEEEVPSPPVTKEEEPQSTPAANTTSILCGNNICERIERTEASCPEDCTIPKASQE